MGIFVVVMYFVAGRKPKIRLSVKQKVVATAGSLVLFIFYVPLQCVRKSCV